MILSLMALSQGEEGFFDAAPGARRQRQQFAPESDRRRLGVPRIRLGIRIVRVDEQRQRCRLRHDFVEQLQPFRKQ
jgi:hypothetical protein